METTPRPSDKTVTPVQNTLVDQVVPSNINLPRNDEQAATVMAQNSAGAEAVMMNSLWEYAVLRENNRADDTPELVGAANDAANARCFINLFQESFKEFKQSAEYNRLQLGEQAKWRPTLRDANGQIIGMLNCVLLNPTLPQLVNRPVVQIILPNRDYLQEVAHRLSPAQQQAIEKGQPVSLLDRHHTKRDDAVLKSLMDMMTTPPTADQPQRVASAMAQYHQAQQNIVPHDVVGLRQAFERIAGQTLQLQTFKRDVLVDKMLEANSLHRLTYHPDINIIGRQVIHMQAVPMAYKGVDLQPAQIRNLLLGNVIEVAGIHDPKRPGLYRAAVSFNVLHNRAEESTKREQIKTESKIEFQAHQHIVHQRGTDQLPLRSQTERRQRESVDQQDEATQRPKLRIGR